MNPDKNTVIWQIEHDSVPLAGIGERALLSQPLTAFFASRRCPGAAIRAALDWALQQARTKTPVISGFHSPLEQSALKVLLQAKSPVVGVIARSLEGARLDRDWHVAINEGRMVVLSAHTATGRLTEALAVERNDVAALLAQRIVIAHAEPAGALDAARARWLATGFVIERLATSIQSTP
jgi:predicted Rossmann fold nucleotide-binding protein DprA/Smf involved in DNA uptake